jgi:tetratricopeptide (TPR) repeat protein
MQDPEVRAALCEALTSYRQGDLARAEEIYRGLIRTTSEPLCHADLGVVLEARGKHHDAMAAYCTAIDLAPREARPHYHLGNLLWSRKEERAAAESFRRALALKPDYADAHNNLGRLLMGVGQVDVAAEHFRKAVAADPKSHFAHNNLGTALHELGRLEEAKQCYRAAVQLKPEFAEAYGNLGSAHLSLDEHAPAICNCRKAVELDPVSGAGYFNLANALRAALQVEEALLNYERAIALCPDAPGYRWNYATALLQAGDYERGWNEYECRWTGCRELRGAKPVLRSPEWRGEDITGKTLLIWGEQGFGDVIQFARYATLAAECGARVVVACQRELVRLLRTVTGVSQVVAVDAPLPAFDAHCSLLTLPKIFGTTIETIPPRVPYVAPESLQVMKWRERLEGQQGLKVGLVWGGRASNSVDRKRSVALSDLTPLAGVGGVRFFSLQKGEHANHADAATAGMTFVDWTAELDDFADTAALIENLDLVISVDTATAHLAGALGKPTWLLNRYESDWRWLLHRSDSPWYPTLTIYRQQVPGDWSPVIARVAAALAG